MLKNSDNTPRYEEGSRVKVAGQHGTVDRILEDGRVVVDFDNGQRQAIEPDKVKQ